MTKDIRSRIAGAYTVVPAVYSSDQTGVTVDLQGFESAAVLLLIGVGGITFDATNKIEFVMQHGDASDMSDAAPVGASDVQGVVPTSGIIKALTSAHTSASITEIGYIGGKRYIRVNADFSGTHATGTPFSVLVVKGHPQVAPA